MPNTPNVLSVTEYHFLDENPDCKAWLAERGEGRAEELELHER